MSQPIPTTPLWHFDRGKPFYPLIMNYLVLLFGFKEFAVRGTIGPRDISPNALEKDLAKILGPLELRCEFQKEHIIADADEIAQEIANNSNYVASSLLHSAGVLLILAHEISKDRSYHAKGPLWEFLRHCRNAAAHQGAFNLVNGEPRRLAEWRGFRIDASLNRTPLFKNEKGVGFISPGDPIGLLWDIEQAYPNMSF